MGIKSGPSKANVKANSAADAAFRLPFHPLRTGEAIVLVIIGIDECNAVFFGKTDVLVRAQ